MPFKNIPQQKEFFYDSKWNPEMDSFFLSHIINLMNNGNWKGTSIPTDALHDALGVVNALFGCGFTWNDVYNWYQALEQRYRTFKEVIDIPHTHWDVRTNCVIAVDGVWEEIFKKNQFAKAYYHHAELEFDKLAILFGPYVLKVETKNTMIIISDSTQSISTKNTVIVVSDDEDVTSPVPHINASLRLRLFDLDNPHVADLESSNNKGPYYIDGDKKFSLRNAFPPRPNFDTGKPRKPPGSSFCGSSSPSKWWKNSFI